MKTIKITHWEVNIEYPEDATIHFSNEAELDYSFTDYVKDTPHRICGWINAYETTYDSDTGDQRPLTAKDFQEYAKTMDALACIFFLIPNAYLEVITEERSSIEYLIWLTNEQFEIIKPKLKP